MAEVSVHPEDFTGPTMYGLKLVTCEPTADRWSLISSGLLKSDRCRPRLPRMGVVNGIGV